MVSLSTLQCVWKKNREMFSEFFSVNFFEKKLLDIFFEIFCVLEGKKET
jgi:hypothetical protein